MKSVYKNFCITFLLLSTLIVTAQAADGDLDTTFGTGGKVSVDFNGNPTTGQSDQDSGLDVTVQPDGKIIIVGESNISSGDSVFSATRLNADGTVDTTFGTNGRFMYNAAAGLERAYAVAVQGDGKIIITGRTGIPRNRVVIRLEANGTFDTTFGTNGIFTTPIGSPQFDEPEIAIQDDGKIVVIGTTRNGVASDSFSVMRLNTNGTFDTSFDNDGQAITSFATGDRAYGVKLQADGKIVVVGGSADNGAFAVARYNTDGSLDTSFNTDGKLTTSFSPAASLAYNVNIQADGKILVAGYSRDAHADGVLVRYNSDGKLDTTFSGDGIATFGSNESEIFWDVHLKNNKIICTGYRTLTDPSADDDFLIVRFNDNGTVDNTFGTAGAVYTDFGIKRDLSLTSAMQADGKLVLAGYTTGMSSFNPDFAAARYNVTAPKRAPVDFNGDGKTDFAVLRSAFLSPGAAYSWWTEINGTGETSVFDLGVRNRDQQVPQDYDGDGKTDIAMYRFSGPEAGNWFIFQSSTGTFRIEKFGQLADVPNIVDDYDGDGKADLAVWRVPTAAQGPGQAYLLYRGSLNNPQGNITYIPWGMRFGTQEDQRDDIYSGDFDGDGRADIAVQRRVDITNPSYDIPAVFWIRTATGNVSQQFFGLASDRIVPGDYDGDGKTDLCVARGFNISPSDTTWFIRYSAGRPDDAIHWGAGALDVFTQGDYDGDGTTDLAVFRRNDEFNFYIRSSMTGAMIVKHWGIEGDIPIAGYNNR